METLELRETISKEWRTDDYIRKQLLCNKLKYSNQFNQRFILDYNINDYDGIAEEKYIKDDKENIIYLKTYLNKNKELVNLVQTECEIKFVINAAQEEISCQLIYFYHRDADQQELRRKKAIVLETFSYEEFRRLVMHVGFDDFENYSEYKNYFTEIFKSGFLKAKSAEELKFLYTNTPEFVLRGMALENETLFGHLLALTKLDDTGIFSGWKDGSSALINVLKAFPDHIFLLNKFRKSPELCNRIYFNLDGVSEFNGEMKSNRIIFATILMEYCLFSYNRPKVGAPTFKIGNEYKVNTEVFGLAGDLLGFGKSDEKIFFLQQQKEVTKRIFIVPKEGDPNATEQVTEDLDKGAEFYPLDMVYFIKQQTSEINGEDQQQNSVVMMVPAIYVKALADAEKWEDINETIRIVADMVGVVFGIGTLALSGNPYLLLAAAADLSLALPDLTIQAFRAEIAKLPGGDEFLRQWDLIYNVLGSAVAVPQLVVGVAQIVTAFYRSCLSLLKLPQTAEKVREGLRASAISVFLDINSGRFERSQLKFLQTSEWVIPSGGFFDNISGIRLENIGAAFIEIVNETGKASKQEYMLIYRGLPVAKGNKYIKPYAELMQKVKQASYSEEKLVNVLEEALDDTWKYFPKEPASGAKYSTTSLENMYTIGSKKEFEKGVKYLNEKERETYEIFVQHDKIVNSEGNLIDTSGSISILEDGTSDITDYAIFVMAEDGKLYLSKNRKVGEFHHSSFLAGNPVAAAGEIIIKKGVIIEINNASGHYKPSLDFVKKNILKELSSRYYFVSGYINEEGIKFTSEF
ncbi:hypothetical protein FW781_18645 [Chryseobacterium panacisoli]|uniref:Uncharacterized protein n=1 Tax=Chryseobacterium panacisoli TaxID=1807141 RepID=A0A5D8ZGE5_9FLAO|nr:hypothetical protein [Chryseobacterium panacisoli]TZF93710.1 hypothetical protein FW781_18645 [Chryseobacterium panacisoli]